MKKNWAAYKQALKTQIYEEWEQRWINDNAYRMTKIFYPKPHSNKAKCILKLKKTEIKTVIKIISGQNNLNYMNNKVYGSDDQCRFCEEEDETFDHLINECPCFYLDQVDLLQNQPIVNTTDWNPIWSEWRLTVIAATVRIALVDILDLSEVDIPAGVFLHPAVGWG